MVTTGRSTAATEQMAAISDIAQDLTECYTLEELRAGRKLLLDNLTSPQNITDQDMDGVSFSVAPKSIAELRALLDYHREAIRCLEAAQNPPTEPVDREDLPFTDTLSSGFNFGRRICP